MRAFFGYFLEDFFQVSLAKSKVPVFAKKTAVDKKVFALTFLGFDHLYPEQNNLRNLMQASDLQNSSIFLVRK